jgi:malonyl-CoA O-methyltransferase
VQTQKDEVSKVIKQFTRFAHQYERYNVIQAEVAKELIKKLPSNKKYTSILDIGCGNGAVYKRVKDNNIDFDTFIALDSSKKMLELHPENHTINKIFADFNEIETYNKLSMKKDTLLLSSSALQWSKNLDFTFMQLSQKAFKAYFSIFTSNTFKTLHKTANISSPIYSSEILQEVIQKYYHADFEIKEYRLEFETVREMLHYIKKSGVSGGEKRLGFKQVKELIDNYPLDYLEFEVLFVKATSLAKSK